MAVVSLAISALLPMYQMVQGGEDQGRDVNIFAEKFRYFSAIGSNISTALGARRQPGAERRLNMHISEYLKELGLAAIATGQATLVGDDTRDGIIKDMAAGSSKDAGAAQGVIDFVNGVANRIDFSKIAVVDTLVVQEMLDLQAALGNHGSVAVEAAAGHMATSTGVAWNGDPTQPTEVAKIVSGGVPGSQRRRY